MSDTFVVKNGWLEPLLESGADGDLCLLGNTAVTWGQWRAGIEREVVWLRERGVGPGSTAALQVRPSFTYLRLLVGLWLVGAQVHLFDHRTRTSERDEYVRLCRPQFLVRSLEAAGDPLAFVDERDVLVERLAGGRPASTRHCLVQFTSGSTDRPKVIGRTAASIAAELDRWDAIEGSIEVTDRALLLGSPSHTFGLVGGVLQAMRRGAALAFARSQRPGDAAAMLREGRITIVLAVPAQIELLAGLGDAAPLPDLRAVVTGGERLSRAVHRRFLDRYGVSVGQAYGMTEVGIVAADVPGRFPSTAGPVAAGLDVELRDGELYLRLDASPYLHPDGTDAFRDGWLRTFDRARLHPPDGALEILGRSDSLVAIGGLKVNLMEVEAVLREHPAVSEAVVVMGDHIEAYVGAPTGVVPGELVRWCRRRLADYKIPRGILVRPELPRTATGKLIRNRGALLTAVGAEVSRS